MNDQILKDNKKEQSLSEAYTELEKITEEFERGEVDLEQGIPKFKRGLELAKNLKARFSKIENDIEEIKIQFQEPQEELETPASDKSEELDVPSKNEIPF